MIRYVGKEGTGNPWNAHGYEQVFALTPKMRICQLYVSSRVVELLFWV